MLQKNVDWQFNPPAGSHHGGVWERIIRIIRKAMNSVVREQTLDDEGLNTLMCEIEYMINDRSQETVETSSIYGKPVLAQMGTGIPTAFTRKTEVARNQTELANW